MPDNIIEIIIVTVPIISVLAIYFAALLSRNDGKKESEIDKPKND
ncbi:MAG: hypothetical protein ABIJ97_03100 [Bacteroidota bacterium]